MRPSYMANHRKDASEGDIRDALEKAGFMVWDRLPCDLLTFRPDKGFQTLECKTPDPKGRRKKRYDQKAQEDFIKLTKTPVALTPEQAIRALEWPLAQGRE